MPCQCDPPSWNEIQGHRLDTLLFEVGIPREPRTLDAKAALLCKWCKEHDVKAQSLELQIWWRDHQIADARRKEEVEQAERKARTRRAALGKLTAEEKRALGLSEWD